METSNDADAAAAINAMVWDKHASNANERMRH